MRLQNIQVKFVYESHRLKVKVTKSHTSATKYIRSLVVRIRLKENLVFLRNTQTDRLIDIVLLNANRVNARLHFFTERIAPVWNSLPPAVVDFKSLPLFKKTIYAARVNLFTRH